MAVGRLQLGRTICVAIGCGVFVAAAAAGERVIFSKPDSEVPAPKTPESPRLPQAPAEIRHFDFSPPPVDVPYLPPPVRNETRKPERKNFFQDSNDPFGDRSDSTKDDNGFLGMTPDQKDKDKDKALRNMLPDPMRRYDPDRALAPIRQFDWMPESSDKKKPEQARLPWESRPTESVFSRFNNDGNSDRSGSDRFGGDNDREQPGFLSGLFKDDRKAQKTPQQMEHRAELEKLLNPNYSPLARTDQRGGVNIYADPLKPAPPIAAPAPASVPLATRPSLDPMQAFNDRQQTAFRGRTMDDITKKVFGDTAPARPAPPSVAYGPPKTPLMRQPTFQEFPSRRF